MLITLENIQWIFLASTKIADNLQTDILTAFIIVFFHFLTK